MNHFDVVAILVSATRNFDGTPSGTHNRKSSLTHHFDAPRGPLVIASNKSEAKVRRDTYVPKMRRHIGKELLHASEMERGPDQHLPFDVIAPPNCQIYTLHRIIRYP